MNTTVVPEVSILIPFHNRADLTLSCLESLFEHTTNVAYEIILVDDASTEPLDIAPIAGRAPLRVLRNERRQSYSVCNNLAAAQARGTFLCLLNNDTLVTPNWLRPILELLRSEPGIGVLGNKHLFPTSELLHHAGIAFRDDGFPLHLHPHGDPAAPAVNFQRDVPSVTFACALIPAAVYRQLGGLDEAYRNGFEDCDFCLRARAAGYRVTYSPASVIYHYGQLSPGRLDHEDANWTLFQSRWAAVERNLSTITKADRSYNTTTARLRRIRKPPTPGLHMDVHLGEPSAFTWASVDLIMALVKAGVPVSVPPVPFIHKSIPRDKAGVLRGLMSRHKRGTYHVRWSHYRPAYMRVPLAGEINAELFCINYRFRPGSEAQDLWMRHVKLNNYRKLPVAAFNQQALEDIGVPGDRCRIMPLGYSPEIDAQPQENFRPRAGEELHLLLVTNSHDLGRYGTDLAVRALAEAFGPSDPVVVHIKDYGAGASNALEQWIAAQPRFPRVEWHREFLSKHDLLKLYARMDVQLAPFRGEGFAMKLLDGMAVGLPALFPAFGGPLEFAAAGTYIPLEFDEVDVGPCLDREEFFLGAGAYWCEARHTGMVEKLRRLPHQREELARIGSAAREYVRGRFSWDASAACLMRALRAWEGDRSLTVSKRRGPSAIPLSVVVPTKDRIEIFEKTLNAYADQSLDRVKYELIVVNDHGNFDELKALISRYSERIPARLMDNAGPGGPAAARNLAIGAARGDVVLITGDDIIPERDFLEQHMRYHMRFPQLESAMVGLTLWHPDLPMTPFQKYITGEGGHQFAYADMKDGRTTMFDRLYTSNCSLKRAFLVEEETLFSTDYRYAAFEDVELGYRLHLRGMKLRFAEKAIGLHLHAMTPTSFLERQRKVGRMLTVMALQRPSYVPDSHMAFLRALEFMRCWPGADAALSGLRLNSDDLVRSMLACYESMLGLGPAMAANAGIRVVDADRVAWAKWMDKSGHQVWEFLNEIILRLGMAEEWCKNPALAERARTWVLLLTLPRTVGFNQFQWQMPFAIPEEMNALFPNSKLVFRTSKFLRDLPGIGRAVRHFEESLSGQMVRGLMSQIVKRRK